LCANKSRPLGVARSVAGDKTFFASIERKAIIVRERTGVSLADARRHVREAIHSVKDGIDQNPDALFTEACTIHSPRDGEYWGSVL
jgi:hypothetical protein